MRVLSRKEFEEKHYSSLGKAYDAHTELYGNLSEEFTKGTFREIQEFSDYIDDKFLDYIVFKSMGEK